jgi:hypothetical protein
MKKNKLSKNLKRQLSNILENHCPAQMSQDVRNIYLEYLYHTNKHGISIHFQRQLLAIQELCNWLDEAAAEVRKWNAEEKTNQ